MSLPLVAHEVPLAPRTTLRLGGPAREFVTASTEAELIDAVTDADASGIPVLVLAGGSNVVIGDEGFDGRVIHVQTAGIDADVTDCYGAWVRVAAGESWDGLVERAVASDWVGVEALSGIPGSVGATPMQNVGAYGEEVSSTIARVEAYDRQSRQRATFAAADCGFGYRSSMFKEDPGRFVILAVSFQFKLGDLSEPIAYAELARTLGVDVGARVPMVDVRRAVLDLRRAKGMVLDPSDHDTWSVGSFFTNPVVPAEMAPVGAPQWPADGGVKVSAAWLIEQAGYAKGFAIPPARAGLSTKHTLALTNRGMASTTDLLELALEIIAGVHAAFGITLHPEPTLVNCSL